MGFLAHAHIGTPLLLTPVNCVLLHVKVGFAFFKGVIACVESLGDAIIKYGRKDVDARWLR